MNDDDDDDDSLICYCTHLTASSSNRLLGCRCRRTWRSPPGQNSVKRQSHFGESILA